MNAPRRLGVVLMGVALGLGPGCAPKLPLPEWYQEQWVILRHGRVAMLPQPGFAPRGLDYWGGAFGDPIRYGPYQVLLREGAALLLDARGTPVWAGTWVIPVRYRGSVTALLLLRAPVWVDLRDGGIPFDIDCLHFGQGCVSLEPIVSLSHIRFAWEDSGRSPWVVDIDGDGSEEVLTVDDQPRFRLQGTGQRSVVMLWAYSRTGVELVPHAAVQLDCRAHTVGVALREAPWRELRICAGDEEAALNTLGAFRRDPETGIFAFHVTE